MGMGYQGFVKFYSTGPATGPMVVLATGASVNLVLEPIYSTAVWGAGWYNAADAAHYADAALRYEGNVEIELQMGAAGVVWDFLADFIVAQRAYSRSLDISPDGAHVYQYRNTTNTTYDTKGAWCRSAGFSTSEGSFVTCSLGIVAIFREDWDPSGIARNYSNYSYILQKTGVIASDCTVLAVTNPLNPSGTNVNPIPFWKTNAQLNRGTYPGAFDSTSYDGSLNPQAGTETVEWTIDISNHEHILYTCSGSRLPRAVLMGPMDVSGNVTLYHPNGVFDPILGPAGTGTITTPYMYAENSWFGIQILTGAVAPNDKVYIEVPATVIQSDEYSITGADTITNRGFGIKGLGGRCNGAGAPTVTLPPCVISDYTGAIPS